MADIEGALLDAASLDARRQAYPELRAKIATMVSLIENAGGDVEKAAVAEQQVIDAVRDLGNTSCTGGPPGNTRKRKPSTPRSLA